MLKIFKVIQLYSLKMKLKKYQRGAKSYEKMGIENNYYNTTGIPELKEQINSLNREITTIK